MQRVLPAVLNITGPEIISVREAAVEFGKLFGVTPVFENSEAPTALLNNASTAFSLFGKPKTPLSKVIRWIAQWISDEKDLLGKPTHFEVRDGKY